ncbi:MAG: L,D-transpeptidase [Pseudolabrys sp.]
MTVTIDGAPTYRWAVSTGRSGYDTPSGSFRAIRLERVYYSKKFDDAPMPNSVFFYGGYAIHGTYEEAKLGNPVVARLRAPGARERRDAFCFGARTWHEQYPHCHYRRPDARAVRACAMARLRGPDRDYGFEQFRPAPRRVVVQETRQTRGDDSSRDAWLRSLDRNYGISTR